MCGYIKEYNDAPCCTHECNGCIWYEEVCNFKGLKNNEHIKNRILTC